MTVREETDGARIDAWMLLCDVFMDWLDDPEVADYHEGVIRDLALSPYGLDELETILLEEVVPPLSAVSPSAIRGLVRHALIQRIVELREEPEDYPEDDLAAARATALIAWASVEPEVRARREQFALYPRSTA